MLQCVHDMSLKAIITSAHCLFSEGSNLGIHPCHSASLMRVCRQKLGWPSSLVIWPVPLTREWSGSVLMEAWLPRSPPGDGATPS